MSSKTLPLISFVVIQAVSYNASFECYNIMQINVNQLTIQLSCTGRERTELPLQLRRPKTHTKRW